MPHVAGPRDSHQVGAGYGNHSPSDMTPHARWCPPPHQHEATAAQWRMHGVWSNRLVEWLRWCGWCMWVALRCQWGGGEACRWGGNRYVRTVHALVDGPRV